MSKAIWSYLYFNRAQRWKKIIRKPISVISFHLRAKIDTFYCHSWSCRNLSPFSPGGLNMTPPPRFFDNNVFLASCRGAKFCVFTFLSITHICAKFCDLCMVSSIFMGLQSWWPTFSYTNPYKFSKSKNDHNFGLDWRINLIFGPVI